MAVGVIKRFYGSDPITGLEDKNNELGQVVIAQPDIPLGQAWYIRLQFTDANLDSYKWDAPLSDWNDGVTIDPVNNPDSRWRIEDI